MKTLITIITMALSSLFVNAQMTSEKEMQKSLDNSIPVALKENNVPGMAIAIIKNDRVIIKKGYGFSNVSLGVKVDSKTGFNIGSISKMFTAWGIMKMVEDGKIDLDTPVSTYITKWKLPTSKFDEDKVTIRNLLQHTAGLSVHGYNGYESKEELTSITKSLSGNSREEEAVKLIMEPESKWQYSGGGYSILQLIIEEVSGETFGDYMQKNIFKPLKMKHTSFNIDKKILKKSAKAYDEEGNEIPLQLFNAQAAAGLHTTIDDLILFAKASFSKNTVLTEKSISLLRTPTELSKGNYGMGYMEMNRFGDFTLHGHGGSNEGWHSGFMLDFESKSGIIILTNGSSGRNVLFGGLKDWAQWHGSN
ncbi:serine hydrolase [uncultured Winogradskyella sp.]|uniref:serine hydrolase domain-containing protein n=1 Tax=uncultured Winogradskyella sp. TaxID=395353 RepID=UPI0026349D77|nr:serine hydrolase domain-containing protein [uncultured Winogradskyella sp.]|tara:strand:- start:2540 stop:3628 length:1089 start_codon:yes stop_codon:yes gene_type:complete